MTVHLTGRVRQRSPCRVCEGGVSVHPARGLGGVGVREVGVWPWSLYSAQSSCHVLKRQILWFSAILNLN